MASYCLSEIPTLSCRTPRLADSSPPHLPNTVVIASNSTHNSQGFQQLERLLRVPSPHLLPCSCPLVSLSHTSLRSQPVCLTISTHDHKPEYAAALYLLLISLWAPPTPAIPLTLLNINPTDLPVFIIIASDPLVLHSIHFAKH